MPACLNSHTTIEPWCNAARTQYITTSFYTKYTKCTKYGNVTLTLRRLVLTSNPSANSSNISALSKSLHLRIIDTNHTYAYTPRL